jgi:hypothetical protein
MAKVGASQEGALRVSANGGTREEAGKKQAAKENDPYGP